MTGQLLRMERDPELESPLLVVMLDGWVDAGYGMRQASEVICELAEEEPVATADVDLLVDHRARRPIMPMVEGTPGEVRWPSLTLLKSKDLDDSPFLILKGVEPDFRWQAFCGEASELLAGLGVRLLVNLGAYPMAVPHTRPVRLTATGTAADLVNRFERVGGTLEVPVGISAALAQQCQGLGMDSVSVWAQIPHYASGSPYPAGAAALLQGLRAVADLRFDPSPLVSEGLEVSRRLDAMIAQNPDHQKLLGRLEHIYDASTGEVEIPSGEELAEELEQFLRDQDGSS